MSLDRDNLDHSLLLNKILELVAKHALRRPEEITAETKIGEELHIVGDDACELLSEFAEKFDVDMSKMNFSAYFPDEATADMHYYLAAIAQRTRAYPVLDIIHFLEAKFWGIFAKSTQYMSLTIDDLVKAAIKGGWDS